MAYQPFSSYSYRLPISSAFLAGLSSAAEEAEEPQEPVIPGFSIPGAIGSVSRVGGMPTGEMARINSAYAGAGVAPSGIQSASPSASGYGSYGSGSATGLASSSGYGRNQNSGVAPINAMDYSFYTDYYSPYPTRGLGGLVQDGYNRALTNMPSGYGGGAWLNRNLPQISTGASRTIQMG